MTKTNFAGKAKVSISELSLAEKRCGLLQTQNDQESIIEAKTEYSVIMQKLLNLESINDSFEASRMISAAMESLEASLEKTIKALTYAREF
jgi:hypothetical protein